MKVVYITDQVYLHGGAERVLSNKVNYLTALYDVKVYIITSEQNEQKPCYPIHPEVIFNDLNINYEREKSYFSLLNLIRLPKHYLRLHSILNKIKPDIIVTLSSQFDYYFLPYIKKGIPKIKEFHSSRHYYEEKRNHSSFFKSIIYRLNDFTEKKYTYIAILTNDEKKYFYSNNTVVIPNALTEFPKKTSHLKNKKIISAGRIAPVKGFENLILAWEIVVKKKNNWILEIYGNGEKSYIDKLNKMVNDASLENTIFFRDATNDIESKMAEASLYVMTSKTECFPMVLLEAMSVGLPVISFDCPNGPKNIITNNHDGLLVPNKDIKLLASAMLLLMIEEPLRQKFSQNAKIKVKNYDKQIIMKKWLNLFNYKTRNE